MPPIELLQYKWRNGNQNAEMPKPACLRKPASTAAVQPGTASQWRRLKSFVSSYTVKLSVHLATKSLLVASLLAKQRNSKLLNLRWVLINY